MIRDCDCAYGSNDLKSGEITTSPSHCSVSSGHINEPEVKYGQPSASGRGMACHKMALWQLRSARGKAEHVPWVSCICVRDYGRMN